ncbi:MAG: patatin-like phospholipase family protein [Betaproteobacteria bacterium]|nr:MAG: patatin-like phospholipase family protein [Betaproteobacteria bacterium]
MNGPQPRVGVILTGGGARAAYQVGVLRAIADIIPRDVHNPFPIICGTSAGAINAAVVAGGAANFRHAVRRLQAVWKDFQPEQVYRADFLGVLRNSTKWIAAAVSGGLGHQSVSLLDISPLRALLARRLDLDSIQRAIDAGQLYALAVTCSGYTSGQSVCFYQAAAGAQPWRRSRRMGLPANITLDHLMASSALPFIFPAVPVEGEYFGDGSMRQIAPVSPALHLGADRVLVIAVGGQVRHGSPTAKERESAMVYPTLAQIAGHALNSIFLDSMEADLERLQRINRTLSMVPQEVLQRTPTALRHIDSMVISPSEELEHIAMRHIDELPRTVRVLFGSVGATQHGGSTLLSYLLFGPGFCREVMALGYKDAMAKADNLRGFLGLHGEWYCELRNTAA